MQKYRTTTRMIVFASLLIGLAGLGLLAWLIWPWAADALADAPAIETALRQTIQQADLTPLTAVPHSNPAQITLGQALYFETELSGNRDVSCATCHHPDFGLSDGLPLAVGTGGHGVGPARRVGDGRQFVPRNTPDVANRGLPGWQTLFWDGRIAGSPATGFISPAGDYLPDGLDSLLAVQAMMAVTSRHEMRGGLYNVSGYLIQPGESPTDYQTQAARPLGWSDQAIDGRANELAAFGNAPDQMPLIWRQLMTRLLALPAYPPLFAAAYPDTPLADMDFTYAANALAAFQTAAFTATDTPWDHYLAGDSAALSLDAKQGALLFFGAAGCAHCHSGSLFTDQQFHNIGAPQLGPGTSPIAPLDDGRYAITNQPTDSFAFRTPSLRSVALTAPYLHNGAYARLEDVVRHHLNPAAALAKYDGRSLPPELRPSLQNEPVTQRQILATLSPLLAESQPLTNRQIGQIVAFLNSLTDQSLQVSANP
ncbi:MAG: cytochrome-c peroxidase [Chloroflexi bacterium]|nr:cytochrome-c peroxidase [Chloroflexota bacterium]